MKSPLAAIREEKGLYVSEVAILADVSIMTIQRIERGNVNKVSPKVLKAIKELGYNEEEFVQAFNEWKKYRANEIEKRLST